MQSPLSVSLLLRMYAEQEQPLAWMEPTISINFTGVGGLNPASFYIASASPSWIICSIIGIWCLSFCAWTRSMWSISVFMACGLDFSSSFTPSPLPPLLSYPVVQRGQVNGGRHDDRWPLQSEGLYINTKQLRFSCTHTNTGVHTHSCRLVDTVFPNTQSSKMMPVTQLVCHSTANTK